MHTLASSQDPFVPASSMLGFLVLLGFILAVTIAALVWEKRLLGRAGASGGRRFLVTLLTIAAAVVLLVVFTDQLNNFFYRRLYNRADYPPEPSRPAYTGGYEPGVVLNLYEEAGPAA